jgi:Uma2 family endonuclease
MTNMSVTVLPRKNTPATDPEEKFPGRIRWTRDDCARMVEGGFLTGRYELIDGVIISKRGQNRPHANAILALTHWLIRAFGERSFQAQLPIDVAVADNEYNEPEPDGAGLNKTLDNFRTRNPGSGDVELVVEVSDSTLRMDQTVKLARYARAGFPEYWILDVNGRRLIRYRGPRADGTYAEEVAFGETESVTCLARPDVPVTVAELFG